MNHHPLLIAKADRRSALKTAAMVLEARWPRVQAYCLVRLGINWRRAHAMVLWPGVLRVTLRDTGELIAQSLPGQPTSLDDRIADDCVADRA